MKKALITSLFAGVLTLLHAQPTAHKFCAVFGGNTGQEYAYDVKQTLNHGYILAGTTNSIGNGVTDAYLIRTDTIGLAVWQKTYGGINIDNIVALDILPDSGFVFAGYTNSYGSGGYDGWLLRTDKNGDTLWTKTYGGTDWDLIYSVKKTWDGGFILAGGTYSSGNGDEDVYLIKTDGSGNIIWTKTYGGLRQDEAREVIEYPADSGYVIAATTHSFGDTLGDGWVLRTDMFGDTIWTSKLGRPDTTDVLYAVSSFAANGLITTVGETQGILGNKDNLLFDLFSNGQLVAPPYYAMNSGDDWYTGVAFHLDARSAIIGTTYSSGSGNGDFQFHERNFTGFCSTTFGTLQQDYAYAIDTTADGGYIACGFSTGFVSPLPDMFLLKIDSVCGSTVVLGVHESNAASVTGTSARIYPNPVRDEAQLFISSREILPRAGGWQLQVFDISGRLVSAREAELQNSSEHSAVIPFHRGSMDAGAYTWLLSSKESVIASGKLIVSEN